MRRLGFNTPTQIQSIAWPVCLARRDTVAIAPTGSGKTLAYLLPALALSLSKESVPMSPLVMVVVPTRELAQQVHASCTGSFTKLFGTRCVSSRPTHPLSLQKQKTTVESSLRADNIAFGLSQQLVCSACCVTGGADRQAQLRELGTAAGVSIVVGTPVSMAAALNACITQLAF